MKDNTKDLLFLTYNLSILLGTFYLIQFYNWSPWWALIGLGLLQDGNRGEKGEK